MSDEELNSAENERNKRLKSLEGVACGVAAVAMLGILAAMRSHGEYSSHGARHCWIDLLWLVNLCSTACRMMLMQKRTDLKGAPSPVFTLGLSQRLAGAIVPVRSEHWNGDGSPARGRYREW